MKLMISAALASVVIAGSASAQAVSPRAYVTAAGASDLYEITSSRTVLETTRNPKLREFAQMMVAHHTKSTADVKAAAARSSVPAAPPKLNPMQQKMVTELRGKTGAARDATYIAQQKTAHDQALALQQGYAANGTAPALKAAATAIVPVVEQHIAALKTM